MIVWIVSILLITGATFVLVAAIGLVKMPDFYIRMHAAAKAGAFGASLIMLSCAMAADNPWTWAECALIIAFFFITAPIASHMIGRAAYIRKVKVWEGTAYDEAEGKYDLANKCLKSHDDGAK